jgi:hypothetical protein
MAGGPVMLQATGNAGDFTSQQIIDRRVHARHLGEVQRVAILATLWLSRRHLHHGRAPRDIERCVIYNLLKNKRKNSEGLIPGSFPPPVAPPGTFSPPRRMREKHVISKALT